MTTSNPNRYAGATRRVVVATAAAMVVALTPAAWAQPGGGPGGAPGAGRQGPGDVPFGWQVFEAAKAKLDLDNAQLRLFDQARAEARAAREAARANRQGVRDAMRAELAKAEPDLAAVARIADGAEARNRALRDQARDRWLRLYASLSAAQKATIRDALAAAMERSETARGEARERDRPRPAR